MEEWKQKAIQYFPYLEDFLDEDDTLYTVFSELSTRCEEMHEAGDVQELAKIYTYAEWCLHQPDKVIWNPAGVAFYEHLVDAPTTLEKIPRWLSPQVFHEVSGLFQSRMEPNAFAALEHNYYALHPEAILSSDAD